MQRSAMRELAFKLVYEIEIQKNEIEDDELEIFVENNEIDDKSTIEYLKDIKHGLADKYKEINELIEKNLKENWSLDRVSKINLSLLKVAIYEMVYKKLPYKVAINEVVELDKKYSDDLAPNFINGVLASIVKEKKLDEKDNK